MFPRAPGSRRGAVGWRTVLWVEYRWNGSRGGGGSANSTLACSEEREVEAVALWKLEMLSGVEKRGKSALLMAPTNSTPS